MALGDRIRRLMQEADWTQAELAEKVSIHQKQISAYERGTTIPSTEIPIRIAEVFDVTLDYLAFDDKGMTGKLNVQDRELLRRFEAVDRLPDGERSLANEMLDLLILKSRFQELVESGPVR